MRRRGRKVRARAGQRPPRCAQVRWWDAFANSKLCQGCDPNPRRGAGAPVAFSPRATACSLGGLAPRSVRRAPMSSRSPGCGARRACWHAGTSEDRFTYAVLGPGGGRARCALCGGPMLPIRGGHALPAPLSVATSGQETHVGMGRMHRCEAGRLVGVPLARQNRLLDAPRS